MQAAGTVTELILLDGLPAARILCPPKMIPPPGKYLLAHAGASDSPPALRSSVLAAPVFAASSFADGFIAAPPAPETWFPGARLNLRGPLGHGFRLPVSSKRVALIAFDASPRRLLALLDAAFKQDASVTLVCENPPDDLPLQVEVQPLRALTEACAWADYAAFDAARESLPELREKFGLDNPLSVRYEAQILVRAPMPCGALAECGVCAVGVREGYRLICDDGPVFDLKDIF